MIITLILCLSACYLSLMYLLYIFLDKLDDRNKRIAELIVDNQQLKAQLRL